MGVSPTTVDAKGQDAPTDPNVIRRRQLVADLLSLDVITAKGDVAMQVNLDDTFFAQDSPTKNEIQVLARTIIQFGGDQLTIIPTDNGHGDGNISSDFNREIWQLHMENVSKALERRKDNLETIREVIKSIEPFMRDLEKQNIFDIFKWLRPSKTPSTTNA
jgi:hypothetical protein